MKKLRVAVLAATGIVGQRYVHMLQDHPFFELAALTGNASVGKRYGASLTANAPPIGEEARNLKVLPTSPDAVPDVDLVFSPLPTEAAKKLEPQFARRFNVVSDASANRMAEDVPLIIPEVNPSHLVLLGPQKERHHWRGSLVSTPNCTVTGLALVLKPLHDALGLKKVVVSTLQAVSGAGYPGVPSLDLIDNVIPYIEYEEQKVESEPLKILGEVGEGAVSPAKFEIGAMVHRVSTTEGHLESVYVETEEEFDADRVVDELRGFRGEPQELGLPTAPREPVIVTPEVDRPQPRLDRDVGTVPGMSVVVGRVRAGPGRNSGRLTLLAHNSIRGAAGSAILTAELMHKRGLLE
ncbi:MAG: aspartate-semialdehyde dehydrogenase [Thaumarchaeota archaeon]|nr:aspartate-semialdehyde dehydrogenase [Nitrososphaerota archaeon]